MKTILVVEDEFIIANRLQKIIAENGLANCFISDTYQDAIEKINNHIIDLILLDIQLFEDKDAGLRIANYVKEKYTIPILFISGHSDVETLKNAKLYNPATFIEKPYVESQLLIAIKMALPNEAFNKIKSIEIKCQFFQNIKEHNIINLNYKEADFISKKIQLENILHIQSSNHLKRNTILVTLTSQGECLLVNDTLEKFSKLLNDNFIRVHQSFIVNKIYVKGFKKYDYVLLPEGVKVPTTLSQI